MHSDAIITATRKTLDGFLYRTVTRGWPQERVDRYTEQLAVDGDGTLGPFPISRSFQILDNKAGGLLTHTSMMIAALGVSAPVVADNHFEQGVIVLEIMLYLLVALGCLRCLSMFHRETERPLQNLALTELIIRRELFKWCNFGAIMLTVLVFISLPLLYLYVPSRVGL
ncbi:MAG TPA: hypothetical protein VMA30_06460 [Xanthobacteraceae bacterium]|nr:hypothetical protein [Xanthobacteraceae bacterium]